MFWYDRTDGEMTVPSRRYYPFRPIQNRSENGIRNQRQHLEHHIHRAFIPVRKCDTQMISNSVKEKVEDQPPSAKLVFLVLKHNGNLTQKQIIEESMLSERTVRFALQRLKEIDLVYEDLYFADARQNLYKLKTDDKDTTERAEA